MKRGRIQQAVELYKVKNIFKQCYYIQKLLKPFADIELCLNYQEQNRTYLFYGRLRQQCHSHEAYSVVRKIITWLL